MTKRLIQILALSAFLTLSLSSSFRSMQDEGALLPPTESGETNEFKPYICPNNDPLTTLCLAYVAPACVCWSNGTCVNTEANPCSTCLDTEVVSVNENEECPTETLDGTWTRCRFNPLIQVSCTLQISQGCICYQNGTCVEAEVNACVDCQRDDVALVIEGGACPANGIKEQPEGNLEAISPEPVQENEEVDNGRGLQQVLQVEEEGEGASNEFRPDVCLDLDYRLVDCAFYAINTCVCYTNGTCQNAETNACIACANNEVVSANENAQCPTTSYEGEWTRCRAPLEDSEPVICTLQATQGCTCYANGTCAEGYVNSCTDCGRENVVLVIEGGSCPQGGVEPQEQN